MLLVLGSINWS